MFFPLIDSLLQWDYLIRYVQFFFDIGCFKIKEYYYYCIHVSIRMDLIHVRMYTRAHLFISFVCLKLLYMKKGTNLVWKSLENNCYIKERVETLGPGSRGSVNTFLYPNNFLLTKLHVI